MVPTKISRRVVILLASVFSVAGSDAYAREIFAAPNVSGISIALDRLKQLPQAPEVVSLNQPSEPSEESYPDWLDFPLCIPWTPEPEELPTMPLMEPEGGSLGSNNALPSTGTLPASALASGRLGILGLNNGQLGSLGGGGAGGGFSSLSPTTTPSLSPTGGTPVIVRPTGGPVNPEPASIVLFGSGLVGVIAAARRKHR